MRSQSAKSRFPLLNKTAVRWAGLLGMLLIVSWYISAFWFQLALIQGDSMEPAYKSGQIVFLEKQYEELGRGDVIAFFCEGTDSVLIKRIAALPGETIWINNGKIYVDSQAVLADLYQAEAEYAGQAEQPLKLPKDQFFVLGDNLKDSKDSRYANIGCVKSENIIGKVMRERSR